MKKIKNPDFVFVCNKCGHNLFVDKNKVKSLIKTECPSCGEEAFALWTLSREGDYDKEYDQ